MWSAISKLFRHTAVEVAISEELWQSAETGLPFLTRLSGDDRLSLRVLAARFLSQKVFTGAQGFEPDSQVRVSIALQACLPVLRLGLSAYDGWSGIIVYPGDFVIPRRLVDEDGLLHEYDEGALGESWEGGPVVLAWFDDPADYQGANVVIHEFAHKLDMLKGEADGMPPLHSGMSEEAWLNAFDAAYEDFCARVDRDETTEIDPYASEHPAEFFAVLSEIFFTDPELLHTLYPAVFTQLQSFYRLDLRRPVGN